MVVSAAWLTLIVSGCEEKIPSDAREALLSAEDFFYFSVDPNRLENIPPDEALHGWKILGKASIEDKGTRTKLIGALRKGIEANDGKVAACFNPRHAIRVTHDGKTYDFVICFECFSISYYIDGARQKGILVTDSPRTVFNEILKELGLPLAGELVKD